MVRVDVFLQILVPPAGIEPASQAPQARILPIELRGPNFALATLELRWASSAIRNGCFCPPELKRQRMRKLGRAWAREMSYLILSCPIIG